MPAGALFIFFLFCIAIQLGYILYFFTHILSLVQRPVRYTPTLPVSVIICARNEADNLLNHLPAILAQRYSNAAGDTFFEVIVADDASTDHTPQVLDRLQKIYSNLKVVRVSHDAARLYPGKKHAQAMAVAAAKHDVLVMVDADCEPSSTVWLMQLAKPFAEGKEIAIGYGQYKTEPGLLNSFIRWETVHTFLQYTTYARAGRPYMAVGRNMACTRAAYLKAQASPEWGKLPSGDDDLLVRAAGGKENVAVVANRGAFTITEARKDWSSWIGQKQRHLSTGKYYRPFTKFLLALYASSHAAVWLVFFVLLFTPLWGEALAVMLLRCGIYWMLWQRAACVLNEKKMIRFFPMFDFGWMVYNFAFSPYIIWKTKQQWT